MYKNIFILSFLLITVCATAQDKPLYFQQINSNQGLSNNNVNCILQDSRGFMWIGTNDGLNRYDGKQFIVFRHQPASKSSIGGNIISHIVEDKNGFLWIATADGGISRYDYRAAPERQFIIYQNDESDKKSIPGNMINTLLIDDRGILWLGTSGRGVVRFDPRSGVFQQLTVHGNSTVLDLEKAADGKIWAGLRGHGLIRIDPLQTKSFVDQRYNDPYKKLPHIVVAAIYKDSNKDVWIGSWDKTIYRYSNGKTEPEEVGNKGKSFFQNDDALCFEEDNNGLLWIGGKSEGLYLLNRKDNSVQQYVHNSIQEGTIADNRVNCIYKDRENNMWLGTGKGISLYKPLLQQFTQTFIPFAGKDAVKRVFDFTEDKQKNLYIGTDKGLFFQKAGEQNFQFIPLIYKGEKLQASKFYWFNDQLLIGTNLSLFVFNTVTRQCSLLPNTDKDVVMRKIIESRVVSIAADSLRRQPVLWAIPYGHYLAYYDLTQQRWVSRQDSIQKIISKLNLVDNLIRKIVVDRNGIRWIATAKEGLGVMRRGEPTFTFFSATSNRSSGLAAIDVYDVLPDNKGNVWISTHGAGLFYGTGSSLTFQHIDGSPNLCEGMQLDDKNNLWIISGNTLYRYRPGEKKIISWQLPDIEKSGGVSGRLFKNQDGILYAAGNNYFIKMLPEALYKKQTTPGIYITDIKVDAKSQTEYLYSGKKKFSFSNNNLSFEFAAPKTPDDVPVQFEYRMKGLNDSWLKNESGVENFPNLQPGNYVFEVRVAGVDENKAVAAYPFTISPPFYGTWWFYALCILFIALIIYSLYRYRINQLLKQQAMRNKIAQDLHDSVGSTLSSISVYSQVAKIYKQKDKPAELHDTLEKISTASGEMISEMNDIVWAINPRNDTMEKILQRMESFAKPLLQSKEIELSFEYDAAVVHYNLPMEKRKNLYLIFKESVSNALKYAECKKVEVKISHSGNKMKMSITDDGRGFDMAGIKKHTAGSLSGNGLQNMKRRASETGGECIINSSPGQGTSVCFTFHVT